MARTKNQHYVPQFYLRFFSNNKKSTNVLLKNNGRIIFNASIKGQCSKNNFYGSQELENLFSKLEGEYSQVLLNLHKITIEEFDEFLNEERYSKLLEFILFQRLRTEKSQNKSIELIGKFIKEVLDIHVEAKGNQELIDALPYVNIDVDKNFALALPLKSAFELTIGLLDLEPYILINQTVIEFISSDSPIIFYNKAFLHIKHSGVLGIQSKGLMIFCPISSTRCLLLLDRDIYRGEALKNHFIELTNDYDIRHINKLQLHSAESSIYFSKSENEKYIKKIWKQEKKSFLYKNINTNRYTGENNYNNKLIAVHEKQISFDLNLSFLSPLRENMPFSNQPRNKEISLKFEELKKNK